MRNVRFGATRLNYQVNDHIRFVEEDGSPVLLKVKGRVPDGYNFEIQGGGERSLSDEEINVRRLCDMGFEHYPVAPMGLSEAQHALLTRAFSTNTDEQKYVAEIRGEYCRAVDKLIEEKKLGLDECFAKVAEDLHREREAVWRLEFFRMQTTRVARGRASRRPEDMRKPNKVGEAYADRMRPSTIESWYRLWLHAGRDLRILVPLFSSRGDHRPKKAELHETMRHYIETLYLNRKGSTLAFAFRRMHEDAGKKHDVARNRGELISYSGFHAFNKKTYAPFVQEAKRLGYRKAMLNHYVFERARNDHLSMDEIEIDHCLIDLIVVDEQSGRVLGRPWLTVAICRGTRMVVGCHLSFEVPSWASLQRCLMHAFWPKDLTGLGLKNPWPCEGRPKKVFVDNGMEFHSRSLKRAELVLGFALFHLPGRSPWLKGIVERFFGTMNVQVLGHLDGKTFSNTKARDDYKSTKHARTTLTKLRSDLLKWIVDDYHVRYHDGLKGIPLEQWYKRQPPDGMSHVPRFDMLTEFLGSADEKKISKRGVRLYGHYYYHPELSHLRAENGVDHVYEIRSNPYDIGAIQLLKPDGAWLTVPSDRPEQTVGFSIHQNTVHWDLAKALVPEGETVTEDDHRRAIEIAQAESEEVLADRKGKKTVGKVSRYGHDNGTFFTKVGGHSGGRVANDDELDADDAAATDAPASRKEAKVGKRKGPKRPTVEVKADRALDEPTKEEIEAERAARKARMRMAG